MAIIPRARETVRIRTPGVAAPGRVSAPAAAAGQDDLGVGIGQDITRLGQQLGRAFLELRQRKDAAEVSRIDTDFRVEMQNTLFDENSNLKGVPNGIMSRKLANSAGSTQEYDQKYAEMRRRFIGDTENAQQAEALAVRMDKHYTSRRETVIRNEAAQGREDLKVSTAANLKQRVSNAGDIEMPKEALSDEIEEASAIQEQTLRQLGSGQSVIDLGRDSISAQIANSQILHVLDTDPELAQKQLDHVSGMIPEGAKKALQESIDKKVFADRRLAAGDAVIAASNAAEGGLSLKEARKLTFSEELTSGMETAEKEKVFEYVKKRMNEDKFDKRATEQRGKEKTDDLERTLYIRSVRGELEIQDLDRFLFEGQIDEAFHAKMEDDLLRKVNDPRISPEEKSKRYMEVFDKFLELSGAEAEDGRITENADDNTFKKMTEFRDFLSKSKGHMTQKQYTDLLTATERNLSQPVQAKVGFLQALRNNLTALALAPAAMVPIMAKITFDMMQPSTTVEQAEEMGRNALEQAAVSSGTDRSRYKIGEVITPPGLPAVRVIGFNSQGKAEIEPLAGAAPAIPKAAPVKDK